MVNMQNKVEHIFTFKDPSNIGVIQFKTEKAKTTFFQRAGKEKEKLGRETETERKQA